MNRNLIVQIIALLVIILGTAVVILDREGTTIVPEILKGKGMWLVIIGLFVSSIYSIITGAKKK